MANVRSKLAQARLKFLEANAKKTGKNMHMEFMYFELTDIVPTAIQIFAEVGLVTDTQFTESAAAMTVYDSDDTESAGITFTVPYREMEPIVSNKGNVVTNKMQALGSSITYLRRYLYMMCLDIVEHDEIDGEIIGKAAEEKSSPLPAKKEKKPAKPKTEAERKEIKEELVKEDADASAGMIDELKSVCKELLGKDAEQEELVTQIAMKTEGFTKIKESACKELIATLKDMVSAY